MKSSDKKKTCKGLLEEIPKVDHDNEFILTGYRLYYRGFHQVLMSAFECHNETFNVWSHWLGKLLALAFAIGVIIIYPNMEAIGSKGAIQQYKDKLA